MASVRAAAGDAGILRLRIADFPPLQATFGAVRLAFTALGRISPMQPIIVTRDDTDFFAVTAECTHAGCLIPAFGSGKTSTCPCHGSRFGHDGRVIRGPASAPLPRYDVLTDEPGVVQVILPEISSYEVTIQRVAAPGVSRVALAFQSMPNVDYEVLGRGSVGAAWAVHRFALTETGVADQTSIRGNGGTLAAYVENAGADAMFTVSAKVQKV